MKLHKWITEKDFSLIKSLKAAGANDALIKKVTGRANQTVYLIAHSSNLEEYKQKRKACDEAAAHRSEAKKIIRSTDAQVNEVDTSIEAPQTPIYDVLVEIRDEISALNSYITKSAGKGKFRLF